MRAPLDCVPCIIRQAIESLQLATPDGTAQRRILGEVLGAVAEMDQALPPPAIVQRIHRMIRLSSGCDDPYHGSKAYLTAVLLTMYPSLARRVERDEKPFDAAVRMAIAGDVNAPGTGIADDKMVYAYVPDIVRFYLAEEPIIPNVPTFVCLDSKQRQHVLQNLSSMVVKPVNESGGYGLVIGPQATKAELAGVADRIKADPRNYIAQPVICLSRSPTVTEYGIAGRHVDLRPFIVYGQQVFVLPGGLTRVALRKDSLVVNSSQGGGSKDTWVVP